MLCSWRCQNFNHQGDGNTAGDTFIWCFYKENDRLPSFGRIHLLFQAVWKKGAKRAERWKRGRFEITAKHERRICCFCRWHSALALQIGYFPGICWITFWISKAQYVVHRASQLLTEPQGFIHLIAKPDFAWTLGKCTGWEVQQSWEFVPSAMNKSAFYSWVNGKCFYLHSFKTFPLRWQPLFLSSIPQPSASFWRHYGEKALLRCAQNYVSGGILHWRAVTGRTWL